MPTKLNLKIRGATFLILLMSFFAVAFLVSHALSPYININLLSNMLPFLSSTSNSRSAFYGENVDMSQILPSSTSYVVNGKGEDLIDIAANLGVNVIRITNAKRSFNNDADAIYTRDQWSQVLDKMQSKGIKAIILIETETNNSDYYAPDIRHYYLHLVQAYIDSDVFSHSDVYAVDIKNEPLLTDANVRMLRTAHSMIKAKYPNLKQTVGWWASTTTPRDPYNPNNYNWSDFTAGQKIADIVDFYAIHMYGGLDSTNLGTGLNSNLRTKVFISQVENGLQTKKPILIEEFGEANGDAVSDQETIGSPQLQANIYQGVYQALKEMHSNQILGAVAFDFYSRDQYPDAWAIVKNKGNDLLPAAHILQEYALGKNNLSLKGATVVTSQSYLVKDTDTGTTKTLHVGDRIGLKLQLNDNNIYFPSLSANGILQPAQTFQYDSVSDSYYAVYQAISKGSVQITIVSETCSVSNVCPSPAYMVTVNIQ